MHVVRRGTVKIGQIVERVTRGWPYQVRHPALATLRFLEAQPRPILVYQMGKVGSTSVTIALRAAGLGALHVHYLSNMSNEVRLRYEQKALPPPIHVSVERILRAYLRLTSHRLGVVTLVRDPIAREVSGSFQVNKLYGRKADDVAGNTGKLRKRLRSGGGIGYCATWFDRELRGVLGVDVLAHDFDREKGHSIVPGPRVDVLTLKLERLGELWGVLSDFVGASVEPMRQNVRSETEEADAYREVLGRLRLSRSAVEDHYDHPWMRHFYTPDEIRGFCDRWSAAS